MGDWGFSTVSNLVTISGNCLFTIMDVVMGNAKPDGGRKFAKRMTEFLDIVEFRHAEESEDLEAIYRLRYQAYRREKFIESNPEKICRDDLDSASNKYVFGVHIAGRLVSSIRLNILSRANPCSPSMMAFSDILQPKLEQGLVFIDPSRFVTDLECITLYPELPMAMMRIPVMAAQYFNASYGLSSIRSEHAAFYRRVFRAEQVSNVRKFPYVDMAVILLKFDTKNPEDGIFKRYTFFKSNPLERRVLFRKKLHVPLAPAEISLVHPL